MPVHAVAVHTTCPTSPVCIQPAVKVCPAPLFAGEERVRTLPLVTEDTGYCTPPMRMVAPFQEPSVGKAEPTDQEVAVTVKPEPDTVTVAAYIAPK